MTNSLFYSVAKNVLNSIIFDEELDTHFAVLLRGIEGFITFCISLRLKETK